MIKLNSVSKKFAANYAVKNLSLEINRGEVFGFLGPNGAGKTTTIKMILGLQRPSKGEIEILGKSPDSIEVKKKIGYLPEISNFYSHLSGEEFLLFMADIFNIPKEEAKKRAQKLLKTFGLARESWQRSIKTYSKGMKQRIGMAQALINNPEIILLDEPMSGLDPIGRKQMKDIILSLKEEGKTIFFNSHILSDAETICDRVGIINNGKLLLDKSINVLLKGKRSLEDIFIETIDPSQKK